MSKQKEVTYLFGAGASYESMPLVNSFPQRFNIYLEFLKEIAANEVFINRNWQFLRDIKSHLSFDTYFKKLFHQKNKHKDILNCKYYIYLFLLFEHLIDVNYVKAKAKSLKIDIKKEYGCDPRYDALIAALLKPLPESCEFYCKTNFLTWNYDLNLAYSIWNFIGDTSFQGFLNKTKVKKNTFRFTEQLGLIHLNGFMNYVEWIGAPGATQKDYIQSHFQRLVNNSNNESNIEEHVSTFNFSWENVKEENVYPEFISNSIEAVTKSETIIIIGYSFPLYNRLFDLGIFNTENLHNKDIFIIDPASETIKERLTKEFDINPDYEGRLYSMLKDLPRLSTSDQTDAFSVPPVLFRS